MLMLEDSRKSSFDFLRLDSDCIHHDVTCQISNRLKNIKAKFIFKYSINAVSLKWMRDTAACFVSPVATKPASVLAHDLPMQNKGSA